MFENENDIIEWAKKEKENITWHDIQDVVEGFIIGKYGDKDLKETFKKVDNILAKIEPIYYGN